MLGDLNKWAVCSLRGMGPNEGWAGCCQSNVVHAWLSRQTPDFPVRINVGIGINFHEAKLHCVSM